MGSQDQVLRFPLANTFSRQVFRYNTGVLNVLMMYDSGAQIPVWCRSEKLLLKAYPKAEKTERSAVYVIPLFELSKDTVSFKIKNLLIASLFKPSIGCDLLLSETMFSKTDTLTTRRSKRELTISFDNIDRPFECTPISMDKEAAGITVWTQSN